MYQQYGMPHQASSGRGCVQRGSHLLHEDGYDIGVSMTVRTLIDEWESKLINENLARGIGGRRLNHYWIIKNMMGSLMEEMVGAWNYTRSFVL